MLHASWTQNHIVKIEKWNVTNQWYLTQECSLWDPDMFTKDVCRQLKTLPNINSTLLDCEKDKIEHPGKKKKREGKS